MLRATQTINSGFGAFIKGDVLTGVPDATGKAWLEAGLAEKVPAAEEAPALKRKASPRKTTRKVSEPVDA